MHTASLENSEVKPSPLYFLNTKIVPITKSGKVISKEFHLFRNANLPSGYKLVLTKIPPNQEYSDTIGDFRKGLKKLYEEGRIEIRDENKNDKTLSKKDTEKYITILQNMKEIFDAEECDKTKEKERSPLYFPLSREIIKNKSKEIHLYGNENLPKWYSMVIKGFSINTDMREIAGEVNGHLIDLFKDGRVKIKDENNKKIPKEKTELYLYDLERKVFQYHKLMGEEERDEITSKELLFFNRSREIFHRNSKGKVESKELHLFGNRFFDKGHSVVIKASPTESYDYYLDKMKKNLVESFKNHDFIILNEKNQSITEENTLEYLKIIMLKAQELIRQEKEEEMQENEKKAMQDRLEEERKKIQKQQEEQLIIKEQIRLEKEKLETERLKLEHKKLEEEKQRLRHEQNRKSEGNFTTTQSETFIIPSYQTTKSKFFLEETSPFTPAQNIYPPLDYLRMEPSAPPETAYTITNNINQERTMPNIERLEIEKLKIEQKQLKKEKLKVQKLKKEALEEKQKSKNKGSSVEKFDEVKNPQKTLHRIKVTDRPSEPKNEVEKIDESQEEMKKFEEEMKKFGIKKDMFVNPNETIYKQYKKGREEYSDLYR